LLKLLGGHPFSLRVVLPHLKTQQPKQLIEALRQGLDTLDGTLDKVREKSLAVSLDYSFANLSERARRHLPFLALFSERVDADWLHALSSNPDDSYGQAYQAFFGENLQKADWLGLLNEAAEAGILEHLDSTIYKIHPALPWYLRQRLSQQHAAQEVSELEKKLLVFYALLANNYRKALISNAELASIVLRVEEPNLLQNLRLAEQQQSWEYAGAILQALGEVYERIGRKPEFRALRQRALKQIGIHLAEAKVKGQDAFDFWMYLRGVDAREALAASDLEGARAVYQEILDELTSLNDSWVNDKIAVLYHQLGRVAQEQRRFDEATAFYHKALQISEDAGDFYKAASNYHNLGAVAQEQRCFDEATAFYNKALQIREDTGDLYKAASDYHQLGVVAQEQRRFDEATAFYNKALQIREDAGDLYKAASDYHQLGRVAQEQRHFDEATAFYHKALQISEDAGDFYNAAIVYHQLGMVAQEQRRFDEATAFYHKALQISEDAGDFYNAAIVYHQLGMVAQEQRRFDEATAFYHKALEIFEQFQDWRKVSSTLSQWGNLLETQDKWSEALQIYIHAFAIDLEHNEEWIGSDIRDLERMLKAMGTSQFESVWQQVTGEECPEEVRSAIQAASEENGE
jgi:tetratricopeptide (TPR) repeat protein